MTTNKEADDKRLAEIIRKSKMTQAQAANTDNTLKKKSADVSGVDNSTGLGNILKDVEAVKKGLEGAQEAIATVNTTAMIAKEASRSTWAFLKPLAQFAWKIMGPCVRTYKKAWHNTDKNAYEGKIKKGLAVTGRGLLIAFTAGLGIMMIPGGFGGDTIRAVTVEPVADVMVAVKDAARMQFAYTEKQAFYLNRESQTSDGAKDGSYSVKAATEDQQDNFNFIIKPGFLHSQWYLNNRGSLLYNTDVIAAKIPSGEVAKCEVTWYGSYNPFLLYIGAKPVLLDAKCEAMKTSFNGNANGTESVAAASVQAAPAARLAHAPS